MLYSYPLCFHPKPLLRLSSALFFLLPTIFEVQFVLDSPHLHPQRFPACPTNLDLRYGSGSLCVSKIDYHHVAIGPDEHVVQFDIAVEDACGMYLLERLDTANFERMRHIGMRLYP